MAQINANLSENEVQSFEPLPAGKYTMQVIKSEVKPTKAGTGTILALQWQVVEGQKKGRTVFSNINISNPNPTATKIGLDELKTLATAIRHPNPNYIGDSAELHNRPCEVTVTVKPAEGQYREGNEIKGYAALANGHVPAPTFTGGPQPQPTQQPTQAFAEPQPSAQIPQAPPWAMEQTSAPQEPAWMTS